MPSANAADWHLLDQRIHDHRLHAWVFSITFSGHQLWFLFLPISCLKKVILPFSMIFAFCSQQLLRSLTLLPGRSDYSASSLGCSAESIGTATRDDSESLGNRAVPLMGKWVIALWLTLLLMASYASSAKRTWSLRQLESLELLTWLFLTPFHLMITLNWRLGKVLHLGLLLPPRI